MFEMMDAYDDGLELGGMKYHVQREYDRDVFFRRVVAENSIPLEAQRIFKVLRAFEESSDPVILDWSKLARSGADGVY
jgi:hypothetical protein